MVQHRRALALAAAALIPSLAALALGARPGPASARLAQATGTIVTEPTVPPVPAFLPLALRNHDPHAPGPVTTRLEGYVVKLTRAGREACAPGTHVLQSRPEGFPNAEAHAVMHSPHPEPERNLDLYVGDYVEVLGTSGLAPEACNTLTWQLLRLEAIRRILLPPGGTSGHLDLVGETR